MVRFLLLMLGLIVGGPASSETNAPTLPTEAQIQEHYSQTIPAQPLLPEIIFQAIVAAEDKRFYDRLPQYSTITRMVSRQLTPSRRRTITQEFAMGFVVANALSHEQILTYIAHQSYFGRNCIGVVDATALYFGNDVADMSVQGAATLAAMFPAPSIYSAEEHSDRLLARRNYVLDQMRDLGFITKAEFDQAHQSALGAVTPLGTCKVKY